MLKWRILLVIVLACTTMPESVRLAAYCCHFGLASQCNPHDSSAPCPDLPAPCDGEEGKWVVADSVDDHDGSFFWIVEFQPLWRPALSAASRGVYTSARDLFDALHRLRI
jgi:hypothetical protein